ncbi:hypothetical protein DFH09DRAFT_1097820 [Mycena vulgaris]|nr:hypothetical protein DFH09DRAFT_1097820 [Mycena vulgaris]
MRSHTGIKAGPSGESHVADFYPAQLSSLVTTGCPQRDGPAPIQLHMGIKSGQGTKCGQNFKLLPRSISNSETLRVNHKQVHSESSLNRMPKAGLRLLVLGNAANVWSFNVGLYSESIFLGICIKLVHLWKASSTYKGLYYCVTPPFHQVGSQAELLGWLHVIYRADVRWTRSEGSGPGTESETGRPERSEIKREVKYETKRKKTDKWEMLSNPSLRKTRSAEAVRSWPGWFRATEPEDFEPHCKALMVLLRFQLTSCLGGNDPRKIILRSSSMRLGQEQESLSLIDWAFISPESRTMNEISPGAFWFTTQRGSTRGKIQLYDQAI